MVYEVIHDLVCLEVGELNSSSVFVEMEDLLREFDDPTVMDIKIGVR